MGSFLGEHTDKSKFRKSSELCESTVCYNLGISEGTKEIGGFCVPSEETRKKHRLARKKKKKAKKK